MNRTPSAVLHGESKREREKRLERERKSLGVFAPHPSKIFTPRKSMFDGIINR